MTQPHDPCWHKKEANADRTHGPYGTGRPLYSGRTVRVVCCECGATLERKPGESDKNLERRHDMWVSARRHEERANA